MDFRRKNIENIDIPTMNKHLKFCMKYYKIVEEPRKYKESADIANLVIKNLHIYLTYRHENKTVTYHCRLDNQIDDDSIVPLTAYTTLCKYYSIPKFTGNKELGYETYVQNEKQKVYWYIQSTTQFIYYNEEKNNKWNDITYGYDINSSFSYAMLNPMPDTSVPWRKNGIVCEGKEIGFDYDGGVILNGPAEFIFPLMESPFKKFVARWYKFKKNAKTERDKNYVKGMLNYCIGWIQRVNPFLRNAIVFYSNENIKKYIYNKDGKVRDDVLYCNTDSIVSTIHREDIECNLGLECGQWKFEHAGKFAYSDFTTQWEGEKPKYRGVSKCKFDEWEMEMKRSFDVTVDDIPDEFYMPYKMEYGIKEVKGKVFNTYEIVKNR